MNEVVSSCLRAAGWHENRKIDIVAVKSDLIDNGWTTFDLGLTFLSSFNELPPFSHTEFKAHGFALTESFEINYKIAIEHTDWANMFKDKFNDMILPIGNKDIFDLFINEHGSIYCIDADYNILKLGRDLEESLNNLFAGRWMEESSLL